ncbi:MAG: Fic family protein [Candidatus Saccharibacteria bacterium]
MRLNKNTLYILLFLLGGDTTAPEISKRLPDLDIRSIQRALERLVELDLIKRSGPKNGPSYAINYPSLLKTEIPDKILEDENRPESSFNHDLIDWLHEAPVEELEQSFGDTNITPDTGHKISAKELEYLTVELSWKSSALEGNTYTLLDTQLLLTEGIKAKNKTEFETQMILNHKDAVAFIIENPDLFSGEISFATVEELHKIIGRNLGIATGIRKRLVKISASNYTPLASPHQLRENADKILEIIGRFTDPILRSLLALSLVPYLQAFEDGNKRTGRMLANAILISTLGRGFSLRKVSARELALAYLAFYEFNSIKPLFDILKNELTS